MGAAKTLVVADDHVLFRQGIEALLRDYSDLQVVGDASNAMEALETCRALRPDIVLIDADLPCAGSASHHPGDTEVSSYPATLAVRQDDEPKGRLSNGLTGRVEEAPPACEGGIELTRRLRAELPDTRVVLLGSQAERSDLVYEAVRAGALGFVTKTSQIEELVTAIRTVAKGQASIAMGLLTGLVAHLGNQSLGVRNASDPPEEALSGREEQVLELVAQGLGNREIALALCISESTVRSHLHNILDKLRLSNRVQAATYALTSRPRRWMPSSGPSIPESRNGRKGLRLSDMEPLSQPKAS